MDINNRTSHTNTFTKGINADISPMYIKNDEYIDANNIRINTDGDNLSGDVVSMYDYVRQNTNINELLEGVGEVLNVSYCRDYCSVIYKKEQEEQGFGIIVYNQKDKESYKVFECDENIGDILYTVSRQETPNIIKLYIADGLHEIMVLDIKGSYEYTKNNGQPVSNNILYLTGYNEINLDVPTISKSNSTGKLKPAKVQYAYILYKQTGSRTSLSPLSKLYSIYDYNGRGYKKEEYSTVALNIEINVSDQTQLDQTQLDSIRLYRITYAELNQQPTISVVYDQKYQEEFGLVTILDKGQSLYDISNEEFLSLLGNKIVPKIIESKNDYLFASNILYEQDVIDNNVKNFDEIIKQNRVDSIAKIEFVQSSGFITNPYGAVISGNYQPTLIPGEQYRLGLIFYDNKGRKSSVHFLKDVEVPFKHTEYWLDGGDGDDSKYKYYKVDDNHIKTGHQFRFKPIGLKVTLNFSQDCEWMSDISNIEVVIGRKTLDNSYVMGYGVIGTPYAAYGKYFPAHYLTLDCLQIRNSEYKPTEQLERALFTNFNSPFVVFASPEYTYTEDYIGYLKKFKDNISILTEDVYSVHETDVEYYDTQNIKEYKEEGIRLGYYYIGDQTGVINTGSGNFGIPITKLYHRKYDSEYQQWTDIYDSVETENVIRGFYGPNESIRYVDWKNNTYHTRVGAAFMTPIEKETKENNPFHYEYKIQELDGTKSPDPLKLIDDSGNLLIYNEDQYFLGSKSFTNWTSSAFLDGITDENKEAWKESEYRKWPDVESGGKYLLFALDEVPYTYKEETHPETGQRVPGWNQGSYGGNIYTAQIVKNERYIEPQQETIYDSYGNVAKVEKEVENNQYVVNFEDSYCGDGYMGMYMFNYLHYTESPLYHPDSFPVAYSVPLISRVDLKSVQGVLFPRDTQSYLFQDDVVQMRDYVQNKSAYLYNTAYSATSTVIPQTQLFYTRDSYSHIDNRVVCSEQKENGELIDNWLIFKSANYIDVDSRYGQITDMSCFKNILMFWQDTAVGIISSQERQLLKQDDNTSLLLGTGGPFERYDYITTKYGASYEKHATTQSNSSLYWWDSFKNTMLQYRSGGELINLNETKNVKSLVNKWNCNKKPSLWYDNQNKDVVFSIDDNSSIVFNELIDRFISRWDVTFDYNADFNNVQYLFKNIGDNKYNMLERSSNLLKPYIKFIMNANVQYSKVFDNIMLDTVKQEDSYYRKPEQEQNLIIDDVLDNLQMSFITNPYDSATISGEYFTKREGLIMAAMPRSQRQTQNDDYGKRLRGKYIECSLSLNNPSEWFALKYVITKYRISWT